MDVEQFTNIEVLNDNNEFIEYNDCGVLGKVVNTTALESVMNNDNVDITKVSAIAFNPYTHGYYKVE